MTIRFRKRIRLFGGLAHLNLSRGGISFSAGPNGANVNFDLSGRRKHPRATLGLPGTGLFYQADLKGTASHEPQQVPPTVGTEFASLVVKQLQQKPDDSPPNEYIPPSLASDGRRKSLFRPAVIVLVTMIVVFLGIIVHAGKAKVEKTSSQPISHSSPRIFF